MVFPFIPLSVRLRHLEEGTRRTGVGRPDHRMVHNYKIESSKIIGAISEKYRATPDNPASSDTRSVDHRAVNGFLVHRITVLLLVSNQNF